MEEEEGGGGGRLGGGRLGGGWWEEDAGWEEEAGWEEVVQSGRRKCRVGGGDCVVICGCGVALARASLRGRVGW